jgi:hypothetical protein
MYVNWKKCTIGAVLACMPMLMLGGCGDDGATTPTGKIVKGLVSGERVTDKNGVVVTASSDKYGRFVMSGTAPYTTAGIGLYTPLKADGTADTPKTAPVLSAPAGASIISPLSTLVNNDPTGTVMTKLKDLGVDLNTDLSVVSATNQNAIILNEAVGAVLQATGGTDATVIASLVTNVSALSTTTPTVTSIINAVTAGATLSGYVGVVTPAATGASVLQPGPLPTPPEPTPPTPGQNLNITANGSVKP